MRTVGLDIGSTSVKAVLLDDGAEVRSARRPTPWRSLPHGLTEMDPADLLAATEAVLGELGGAGPVAGIGVSGMSEAGALLERDGRVVAPVVAWFDPRGSESLADLPADVRAEFTGRTGLPLGPLPTFVKLWHRSRREGLVLADRQWLTVPELVVWWLGGERRAEVSLAARTGLLDQDTRDVWPAAVAALGTDASLLPPLGQAGADWGRADRHVPPALADAVLTVAGHDHLVASTASGILDADTLYDSFGTAEALLRVLDGVLDRAARARLTAHGVQVVRHLLPGRGVMLAGNRSGLVLRRALQLVGADDDAGRAALDDAVLRLEQPTEALKVSGAAKSDGVLTIRADADGLSPALLLDAALRHSAEVVAGTLAVMDAEYPPARRAVVAGGWTRMRSVRRSREAVLPAPTFSERGDDTAYGAARIAAFAADPTAGDLAAYLAGTVTGPARS